VKRISRAVLLWVLLGIVAPAVAQTSTATRVLFIGNSYTFFNNLPSLFAHLAGSATPPRRVHAQMIVRGGGTLQNAWENQAAVETIRAGHWDYVVLQEQSTLGKAGISNGKVRINSPANFHKYARLFDAEIRKSGARTVFYMTWARQNSPESQPQLTSAYETIGRELNGIVAPVGLAWQEALKKDPTLQLYRPDKSHPTPTGSYIAACVLYAAIFNDSTAGLASNVFAKPVDYNGQEQTSVPEIELVSLDPTIARELQQIAWHEVQQFKRPPATARSAASR
jgi:hypothetical protein